MAAALLQLEPQVRLLCSMPVPVELWFRGSVMSASPLQLAPQVQSVRGVSVAAELGFREGAMAPALLQLEPQVRLFCIVFVRHGSRVWGRRPDRCASAARAAGAPSPASHFRLRSRVEGKAQ